MIARKGSTKADGTAAGETDSRQPFGLLPREPERPHPRVLAGLSVGFVVWLSLLIWLAIQSA